MAAVVNPGDLEEYPSLYHELAIHPPEHASRSETLYHLATRLGERFVETSDASLLLDALRFGREVLELHPSTHPERAASVLLLVTLLRYHHIRFGDKASLDDAESYCEEALMLCPPGSSMRDQALMSFSTVLREMALNPRYAPDISNMQLLLERSLNYAKSAVELRPEGHAQRDEALEVLSVTLSDGRRWLKGDAHKANEQAILLGREALSLRPPGHSLRQSMLYNLARFLTALYERSVTEVSSLEEGVILNKEALKLYPVGHFFRADILVALGGQYRFLWFHHDDMSFKNKGDCVLEEALDQLSHDDLRYPAISRLRALSLYEVYLNTGKITLLDQGIKLAQDSLTLLSWQLKYRCLTALANMLRSRYQLLGDTQSLTEAIDISRQALAMCPPDGNQRSYSLHTMGMMLHLHYTVSQNTSSLYEALSTFQEMVSSCPKEHSQHGWARLKLAKALLDRSRLQRTPEDYNDAVRTMRDLSLHAELASVRHDAMSALADALYFEYQDSKKADLFNEAINYYENAIVRFSSGTPERHAIRLANLSNAHLDAHEPERNIPISIQYLLEIVRDEYGPPRGRFVEAKKLLVKLRNHWHYLLHEKEEVRRALLSGYRETIRLLPLIANFGLDLAGRLRELALAQSLGTDAVSFALSCNEGAMSVEMSEDSRSVFWSQALNLRDAQFDLLPAPAAKELQDLFETLLRPQGSGGYSDEDLADRRRLSERVHQLLSEVRQVAGLDRFLMGQPFSFLARAADKGPLVILTPNQYECNALVLLNNAGDWKSLPLPDISLQALGDLVVRARHFGLSRGEKVCSHEVGSSRAFKVVNFREGGFGSTATTVLRDIWNKIVWPIIKVLGVQRSTGRQRPRLHWCPTGDFSFVPLHAAGIYSGSQQISCSDYVVSSYTPTLTALIQARDGLSAISRDALSALVVAETSPPGLPRIPYANEEAATVSNALTSSLPATHLAVHGLDTGTGAQVQTVLDAMTQAHVVHLACHGQQHLKEPLDSRFCLRDGPLTVSMLMQLKLPKAFFAFLSACETAQGDREQPDQAIHLAAAMLFTGFRSVVATIWPMRDEDGPKVARIFYEEVVKSEMIDADTIAYALDMAVRHLRDSGKVPPERWAPFIHIGA